MRALYRRHLPGRRESFGVVALRNHVVADDAPQLVSRAGQQALAVAVPRSTRAITAAGVTLAVSFALVALIPLVPFRELAFAMAAGVLIDAFVVRSLLVPALISLVGRASGWPGKRLARPPPAAATVRESDFPGRE